jgi:hypothetical protein
MITPVRWLERGREALDERGRGAWFALLVVAFVVFWPVGLALLAYLIWSNRMSCNAWGRRGRRDRRVDTTGNTAFDSYREETLKRLEDEREAFVGFLDQLRAAKDRAEFDQFMSSRRTPEQA